MLEMSLDFMIPDVLAGKVSISDVYRNYDRRGNPTYFGIDMEFPRMQWRKTIQASDFHLLRGKLENTLHGWEDRYHRWQDRQYKENYGGSVEARNQEVQEALAGLEGILARGLAVRTNPDWEAFHRKETFRIEPEKLVKNKQVPDYILFNNYGRPVHFEKVGLPPEPDYEQVWNRYGLWSRLFRGRAIDAEYEKQVSQWQAEKTGAERENAYRKRCYKKIAAAFREKETIFTHEKNYDNGVLEDIQALYGHREPRAVEEYCDLVLSQSEYPDFFPRNWRLEYRPGERLTAVEYDLPIPEQMPKVEGYRYDEASNEVITKRFTEEAQRRLYNRVIYQICIRTLYELFAADTAGAIQAAVFNGMVSQVNPVTGKMESKIILSVRAGKNELMAFDLSQARPEAVFRHFEGAAAENLAELAAVTPVLTLDKTERRVIFRLASEEENAENVGQVSLDPDDFVN